MPWSFADFDLCEILVNVWRFAQNVSHSGRNNCHCSIHLQDCITESKRKWNKQGLEEFQTVISKIINHDEEFKLTFEKVIKYEQILEAIFNLLKKN